MHRPILISGTVCNDCCHTLHTITLCSLSYSLQHDTPFIILLLEHWTPFTLSLYCITLHSLSQSYNIYKSSANNTEMFCCGLSSSTSPSILLVHLVMVWYGRHRQPCYWVILSLHVEFTSVSLIVSFYTVL